MKKSLLGFLLLFPFLINAQTCGEIFTDSGGVSGAYENNANYTVTLYPNAPGQAVKVTFTSFSVENVFDALFVFDGNSIDAPQIASGNPPSAVSGYIPGGYWGNTPPGPFTSTSDDGSLTFYFRSDGVGNLDGWTANVTCVPIADYDCLRPIAVTVAGATTSSITLNWTDQTAGVTQWEYLLLPTTASYPTASDNGIVATTNPLTLTGLDGSTICRFYVRAICPTGGKSQWSTPITINTLAVNDSCQNAIDVPINPLNGCAQTAPGSFVGATLSDNSLNTGCVETAYEDVWYKFTATYTELNIGLRPLFSGNYPFNVTLYSGSCGALTQIACNAPSSLNLIANSLVVGQTYYLRISNKTATPYNNYFEICITRPSTCASAMSVCGLQHYANTTGFGDIGQVGCLTTAPNPTYLLIKISQSGSIKFNLSQTTWSGTAPDLDVDYAAWGPFSSTEAMCTNIPGATPISCSFSDAPIETFEIANAVAGQYYLLLVTNFGGGAGFIDLTVDPTSTGSIDCSGISMKAFIDANGNGTQQVGEANFTLGRFNYERNDDGNVHQGVSSTALYTIYDPLLTNSYDLSYSILPEYAAMYSVSATYQNVLPASGQVTLYNFPITVTQPFQDLVVMVTPTTAATAGDYYVCTVTYANNGNQPIAAGTITFNYDPALSLLQASEEAIVPITNGFTYSFVDLPAFATRTISVILSVPPIPTVTIGQLLTNTASGTMTGTDVEPSNNSAASTQPVVAAYDPNDKTESHGGRILISSFGGEDYLYYTIRFQNVGNAAARNITVTDMIDEQLDENSIVMVSATHDYTLDRLGRSLTWHFDDINLPVSLDQYDLGNGSLTFKIKPKPGFAIGDIIPNTAEIFFDTNPAVVTNTFLTEFVSVLGVTDLNPKGATVFPNPTTGQLNVALASSGTISKIDLYDMLGQHIIGFSDISATTALLNVGMLARGMYLMTIETSDGTRMVEKIVKK